MLWKYKAHPTHLEAEKAKKEDNCREHRYQISVAGEVENVIKTFSLRLNCASYLVLHTIHDVGSACYSTVFLELVH